MENRLETLFDEGIHAYEKEDFETAESKFLEALQIDPFAEEIRYNLALVYFETKQYDLCNKLIAQIRELDCSEIIDELEKVDTEERYSIPESIPKNCAKCVHFTQDSLTDKRSGYCGFYHINVNMDDHCYAHRLAEEGKIDSEEINRNLFKIGKTSAAAYMEQLDTEDLPEIVFCDSCEAEIKLTPEERKTRIFKCASCGAVFNIGEAVKNLEKEFSLKPDEELFEILLNAGDFRIEYLYAARKELKKRNIDLRTNKEFLNHLGE
jgi:tetratricopeptide (TPR) repeat protein